MRNLGGSTALALVVFLIALFAASPAQPAPGDVADLAVTKTDSPDPVDVGAILTYGINVTNQGPQGATNVTVTDRLPKEVDFVSAAASSGNCERKGKRVTCNVGNLSASSSATVAILVRPNKGGKDGAIENTASVESVETDPIGLNNSATTLTTVVEPLTSTCRGVVTTVTGTPGADRLVGSSGPDVIAGLGGPDTILGLSGRDLICSGGGDDNVLAGPARDRAFGGRGADRLLGRAGPDLLAGNPGFDRLKGGAGDDVLRGGRGLDRCTGGSGFDLARGCERGSRLRG
jgi:uncharacterized repeat protein (TIGR01451 family)